MRRMNEETIMVWYANGRPVATARQLEGQRYIRFWYAGRMSLLASPEEAHILGNAPRHIADTLAERRFRYFTPLTSARNAKHRARLEAEYLSYLRAEHPHALDLRREMTEEELELAHAKERVRNLQRRAKFEARKDDRSTLKAKVKP